MAVSKYKSRDWISEITKLKRKLSINNIAANKKLDLAVHVARANIYYHPNSRHFRRLNTCLRKDPDLKEEHAKVILQSFSVFDENGDGRISKREIARAYRLAGFNPTGPEVEELIKEHDANEDGYIDFEEYFNVMKPRMIKLDFEKERMKTAFKVLDLDQDGYITAEELGHALSRSGDSFTDKEIKEIIQRADTNQDGKIDYNEFVEAELCKQVF